MKLRLYMVTQKTRALGFGERYVIWVQGCLKKCYGCMSTDSWSIDGGYEQDINELIDDILSVNDIEGITISGGEPFLQSEALSNLVKNIKKHRNLGVIIYTGFTFGEIKNNELVKYCDAIIDGEYIDELNDDLSLRGSSNQKANIITDRYKNTINNTFGVSGRKIELHFQGDKVTLIGVPEKNIFHTVKGDKLNEY